MHTSFSCVRFYTERRTKQQMILGIVVKHLKSKPNYMAPYTEIIEHLQKDTARYKKTLTAPEFQRVLKTKTVAYKERK